jgi:hypothetical protein
VNKRKRRSTGTKKTDTVVRFASSLIQTSSSIAKFFTAPKAVSSTSPASAVTEVSSTPASDVTGVSSTPASVSSTPASDVPERKCKACGRQAAGWHVCSVCKCPLESPFVCTKPRRIKVVKDVYWCEDCADTDDEVLAADKELDFDNDPEDLDDDGGLGGTLKVAHSFDGPSSRVGTRSAATRSMSKRVGSSKR